MEALVEAAAAVEAEVQCILLPVEEAMAAAAENFNISEKFSIQDVRVLASCLPYLRGIYDKTGI